MKSWQILLIFLFSVVLVGALMDGSIGGSIFLFVLIVTLVVVFLRLNRGEKRAVNPAENKAIGLECTENQKSQPTRVNVMPTNPRGSIFLSEIEIRKSSDFEQLGKISVVDLETTGLSHRSDKIVEIGIISFEGNATVSEFESLVNPLKQISAEASAVNGISDAMVSDAPTFSDISLKVWGNISESVLAAYNATFDTSFLKEQLEESGLSGQIEYFDIMSLARIAFPDMRSRKLTSVATELGYRRDQTHRALDDAKMAAFVMQKSFERIKQNELDELRRAEEAKAERVRKYGNSPLFDKLIAFTGEFNVSREELESMAEKTGAIVKKSVVMKLDYLVVGDVKNLPEWALERKIRKADRYIAKGCEITKISESDYLKLIATAITTMEE